MSESYPPPPPPSPAGPPSGPGHAPTPPPAPSPVAAEPGRHAPPPPPGYGSMMSSPGGYPTAHGGGPTGQIRSTGTCILLFIVTLGIYGWVWYYKVHQEMKARTGNGLGGGVALLLAIFIGVVMPFITSSEVAGLYRSSGKESPVSAATGLWSFPGAIILVGPIVWFVKTNGALNDYWAAPGTLG
jgi:hypothetical protein